MRTGRLCKNSKFRMNSLDLENQLVIICISYMRNKKTEMMKNRIVTWDADGDITDLVDELNDAMAAVFDGTGSDTDAVIVSSGDITDADAQKIWDEAMTEIG